LLFEGFYRPVHVKTLRSQKLRMLLTHRKLLQSKAIAIDNDLRGTLRNFGLKVAVARIKQLVEDLPDLTELERFPAKWVPVRVKKTRQNNRLELRSDSIGTEKL
jgi:transposase